MTQALPSGNDGDPYPDIPDWELLAEAYTGNIGEFTSYPEGEEEIGITDIPRPEMILDRFSASSPVPFSETGEDNISATAPTVSRSSWGFQPPRHHNRNAITPTSGLNVRSSSDDDNRSRQYDSFYQQQVFGAWEREREMDRTRNMDGDGWGVDVSDVDVSARWGLDPDGESEVWGVVDAGHTWAADPYDPESADKNSEGPLFPER